MGTAPSVGMCSIRLPPVCVCVRVCVTHVSLEYVTHTSFVTMYMSHELIYEFITGNV